MQSDAKPKLLTVLDIVAVVMLLVATAMVFFYAPMEAVMGQVQRVFYFHVASAWVGMLAFLVAAIAGVAYLRTGDRKWDITGLSAIEIGIVFALIAIISGSIWARPIWNTWWTWDPRLTTTTIMLLIYAAYLLLRQGIEDPDRRARFGAVYAIIGFLSVPLTFFSSAPVPHHPPGGDRQQPARGDRRVRYDAPDVTNIPLQPAHLLRYLCCPALASHPPGQAG